MSAADSTTQEASGGLLVERVGHSFGALRALEGVSLSVRPGQVHGLLGPSGSGKSTLLRLIAGLERLQKGRITIAGTDMADAAGHVPPERRAVGFVFQDYALFPHLDVAANVGFGMTERGQTNKNHVVRQLLDRLELGALASAMPHTLSGGEQQRVAVARALARNPRVMLMDEPFSGLDTRLRDEVRWQTLEILRKEGVATLLVTHSPPEALEVADEMSVLIGGRVRQAGVPADLYARPSSREVATLFGPIDVLPGEITATGVRTICGEARVARPELEPGTAVEALVRPEGLRLTPPSEGAGAGATVVSARPRGATVSVRVELDDSETLEVSELAPSSWKPGDAGRVEFRGSAPVAVRVREG